MIRCDGRRISGIKWIWRYTLIRKESFLKDVVYTEVYDQRRIDDWSESMHKTVTELAHREIKKDKRLANWAVDHIVESDKTYNLFKGGRKKF